MVGAPETMYSWWSVNAFHSFRGMWGKKVTVGADQIGFVMSKGAVVKELGSGTTKVGTSVLGLTGRKREVFSFRFRAVPAAARFRARSFRC